MINKTYLPSYDSAEQVVSEYFLQHSEKYTLIKYA